MNDKTKEFLKNNLSVYHIIGIVLGCLLAVLYWYKSGKYSDNILKSSIFLISIWGILLGYITSDFIMNAIKRNRNKDM